MKTKLIYTTVDIFDMRKDNKVRVFLRSLFSQSESDALTLGYRGRQDRVEEVAKINAANSHGWIDSQTCQRYDFVLRNAGMTNASYYIVLTPKASVLPEWMPLGTKFVFVYSCKAIAFRAYSELMGLAFFADWDINEKREQEEPLLAKAA